MVTKESLKKMHIEALVNIKRRLLASKTPNYALIDFCDDLIDEKMSKKKKMMACCSGVSLSEWEDIRG